MSSDAMDIDGAADDSPSHKTGSPAPSSSAASVSVQPTSTSASSGPKFKYKYPQAYPTPDGEDDEAWNKLYTAADSRLYNKHGKNANESKKYRVSGETRVLALQMLQDKKGKLASAGGSLASSSKPSAPKSVTKKPVIKQESSTSSRDATPSFDKSSLDRMSSMSISEKIKSAGRARTASSAAPSDHDTSGPAIASASMASLDPPAPKVEKPKKKGTAAPMKKRGIKPKTERNGDNRSTNNTALKSSPSSDDESNDGGEYCICRGPDDHRMMVYCDGGCNDWYHCSCVKINEADAKELLDRFICPKCKNDKLTTTWKRYCRYGNVGKWMKDPNACRKAARVSDTPPSMYCSDAHRDEFWKWVRKNLARQDNEPAVPGGRLSAGEVGWILKQVKNVDDLHALGKKPKLPVKEGADPNHPPGLDFLTDEDVELLHKINVRRSAIDEELLGYKDKEKLRAMVVARAEKAAAHLQVKTKDVCGYDSRLAVNQLQFALWSKSEQGKRALETGILGPQTPETKPIGAHILLPGQVPTESSADQELRDICIKKKCLKHRDWAATYKSDIANAHYLLTLEKKKLIVKKQDLISEAETMEAMRPEYEDNTTIQLF